MNQKKIKYEENVCPFCKGDLVALAQRAADSKMRCVKCGAIFYNLNDFTSGKPGEFTGRYAPVSIDHRYDYSWGKEQKPIV